MKITKSEVIKMEVNDEIDREAIDIVTGMLNDICYNLGEQSSYELIDEYTNVISSKDICIALMVIDNLLRMDNDEWRVNRKG